MTKSAPSTARKLEWTNVSSRSRTRHFFPVSLGWIDPSNFGREISCTLLFVSTLSSEDSVFLLVRLLDALLWECSRSEPERQQHIIRKLSKTPSHSSIMLISLWESLSSSSPPLLFASPRLLLGIDLVAGDDDIFFLEARAPWMACADRGVVALPLASVWVIKSGIATAAESAAGDLGTPGERRSLLPRTPLGVEGLRYSLVLLLLLVSTDKFGRFRCCCILLLDPCPSLLFSIAGCTRFFLPLLARRLEWRCCFSCNDDFDLCWRLASSFRCFQCSLTSASFGETFRCGDRRVAVDLVRLTTPSVVAVTEFSKCVDIVESGLMFDH